MYLRIPVISSPFTGPTPLRNADQFSNCQVGQTPLLNNPDFSCCLGKLCSLLLCLMSLLHRISTESSFNSITDNHWVHFALAGKEGKDKEMTGFCAPAPNIMWVLRVGVVYLVGMMYACCLSWLLSRAVS